MKMRKVLTFILSLTLLLALAAPAMADEASAMATNDTVTVDGTQVSVAAYKIDGSNYFRLRDLAAALSGTAAQFDVSFDAAARTVNITTGSAYTAIGGELSGAAADAKAAVVSDWALTVNGKAAKVSVYNIDGSNYYKLRDIADAAGFTVDYDETARTAQIESVNMGDGAILKSTIETSAGSFVTDYVTPGNGYYLPTEKAGTVVELEYTTKDYTGFTYEGQPEGEFKKTALVYLPYGYNAKDTSVQYDVVYYMHGAGGTQYSLFGAAGTASDASVMLDNLIEQQRIRPIIFVCMSYWDAPDLGEDKTTYDGALQKQIHFWEEMTNDLIPAVEAQFNAAPGREHRAMAGYSAGGGTCWYAFDHILTQVKYWMNHSGTYKTIEKGNKCTVEEITENLQNTLNAFYAQGYSKDDVYVHMTVGDETDKNYVKITSTFQYMMEHNTGDGAVWSYGENISFMQSNHSHGNAAVLPHLYNSLIAIFPGANA